MYITDQLLQQGIYMSSQRLIFLVLTLGTAFIIISSTNIGVSRNWVGFLCMITLIVSSYMIGFIDGVKQTSLKNGIINSRNE